MLQKELKNERAEDSILSGSDIKRLRKAYQNYSISLEDLTFDVKSIMDHEGVSKSKAINHIIGLLQ